MIKIINEKVLDLVACDGVIAFVDEKSSLSAYPALTALMEASKASGFKMNWWTTTYRAPYGHVAFINNQALIL
jgi:hypothetical protein